MIDGFTGDVDAAYAPFDDNYFHNYENTFTAAYKPQLDDSFNQQRRDLILAFADNGNLNSSASARQFGLLQKKKADAEAELGNKAVDSSDALRSGWWPGRNPTTTRVGR